MPVATQPSAAPEPTTAAAPPPSAADPSAPILVSDSVPVDRLYRLSLDEYHRLAETDVLADRRVELIGGLLVKKMTKHNPHVIATALLNDLLHRIKPDGWFVLIGEPITLPESGSEPEPDAMLARGTARDYVSRRIGPADVGLVVEVSDSSLRDDQGVKKALYACSSVPVYWIVNIPARRLEIYTDPTGPDPSPDYRRRDDHGPGSTIPLVLDGAEVARVAVDDLLP